MLHPKTKGPEREGFTRLETWFTLIELDVFGRQSRWRLEGFHNVLLILVEESRHYSF